MQRKATKNTRGPNSDEKRFQGWVKERPCAYCGKPGPSIVDHARGATFKHNKVLVGHWFVTPKCQTCDEHKTNGNHIRHFNATRRTESETWIEEVLQFVRETGIYPPPEVEDALCDFSDIEYARYVA